MFQQFVFPIVEVNAFAWWLHMMLQSSLVLNLSVVFIVVWNWWNEHICLEVRWFPVEFVCSFTITRQSNRCP